MSSPFARTSFLSVSILALSVATPALADDQRGVPHRHGAHSEDGVIVVSAGGIDRLDLLAGATVVETDEIERNNAGQIGDVLAKLPGVSATGFAPGASRPILRGFDGERVRILVDGIGTIDASNTSADHAVTIDPLTANSIEVLRGPAVLLYGSSAIGGAVNVIDRRIPHSKPTGGLRLDTIAGLDTATDLRTYGASLDVALSQEFVWHADFSRRETDDFEIPGFALSDRLRADLLADADEEEDEGELGEAEELREAANQSGIVPSTATETTSLGTGFAWIGEKANFGFSVGYYDTLYGVPTLPGAHHAEEGEGEGEGAEEEEGDESISIDLEQFRADFRGAIHLGDGFFGDLVTRWGYSDYTHTELEGAEIGTVFEVEGIEGRVELIQKPQGEGDNIWSGSFGAQFFTRDFNAIGAEAFVAPNETTQLSLFTLQEVRRGPFEVEFGGRFETSDLENLADGTSRDFDAVSGAVGLSWTFANGIRTGVNLSRSERAPAAEELFADGPHLATQQFEIGDPDLLTEKAWGAEAYVNASLGGTQLRGAVFGNWFDDFIYLEDTGLIEDDLPLFVFLQQDARWYGVEAEVTTPLAQIVGGTLSADLRGSYIRAELDDGSAVPRIPPLSLLGALDWQSDSFDLRGEVEWFDDQNRVASFEPETDGFTHVNLSAAWRPLGNQRITLLVQADNIFDAEGRRHSSFTKEFVPLPGRNFRFTVRSKI